MRDVYEAGSLHEAQMLVDLLHEAGIRTFVRNEHLQGALGELPMGLRPVVCVVDDEQWATAREAVRTFEEARRRDPGPDRLCATCGENSPGNFQVCWKCRQPFAND